VKEGIVRLGLPKNFALPGGLTTSYVNPAFDGELGQRPPQ
jgi:hypothetical protein